MTGRSVAEILSPLVIAERISRLALVGTTLQKIMGWNLGAGALDDGSLDGALMFDPGADAGAQGVPKTGNVDDWPMRTGQYDVFSNTRKLARARVPGQASGRRKPHPVGKVEFTIPYCAEIVPLTDEALHNRRPIGGPSSQIDKGGEDYIRHQESILAQYVANLIEFQTAAMFRGSYTFTQDGDDLHHTFSGGETSIDYQVPAGNKTQLNMLGTGNILDADWATAGTDIPLHLSEINQAMVQLTGKGLAHVVLTSVGWQHLLNNTKVHTQGGSANIVFESMKRIRPGEFEAVLRSLPWITWHIVDYGAEIWNGTTETYTKFIEDDHAAFFPAADDTWTTYLRGGSHVTEGPNGPKSYQMGFYPYSYPTHDPSGWDLGYKFDGFPSLKVPACMTYGLISGGTYT